MPGLLTALALGGRGFFGGIAGTEGFCKSNCFCSLSDLSLNQSFPEKKNSDIIKWNSFALTSLHSKKKSIDRLYTKKNLSISVLNHCLFGIFAKNQLLNLPSCSVWNSSAKTCV